MTLGCTSQDTGTAPRTGKAADSLVADLFSLGARVRLRGDAASLTPRGASLLTDTLPSLEGENVVLELEGRRVRTYSAYARRDRDMACAPSHSPEEALFIIRDDGMDSPCIDTAHVWVPAYPYRTPIPAAYLEGKGFWILAGDIPFARGSLIIHYDYIPEGSSHE